MMRSKLCITLFLALGVLFVLLPAARADQMQLYFTGNTSGGDLVPYEMVLTQPGSSTPSQGLTVWMNCDDHFDLIQGGEYWTATVFQGSSNDLAATSMSTRNTWTEQQADIAYDKKAWIELNYSGQLNNPAYSNAIWHIFDQNWNCDNACQQILSAATTAVNSDSANGYLSYRQSLTIYSGPYSNINGAGGLGNPQEFDTVPDGGMTLMLLGGTLVGVATLRRKFRA